MSLPRDLSDLRALVTGASSGIGRGVAEALARRGARVEILCRNENKALRTRDEIHRACGRDRVATVVCDLGDLDQVRDAARQLLSRAENLDLLINNAGLLSRTRRLSPQGHEWVLAVNHLGPFLLTQMLLPALPEGGRIVNLASVAHTRGVFDFQDMRMTKGYSFWEAYARSKLANVLFTYALARRLQGSGRSVNCVHPGLLPTGIAGGFFPWVTPLWRMLRVFYRPLREGVDAVLRVALDPGLAGVSGRYFHRGELADSSPRSRDEQLQEALWAWSEDAVRPWRDRSADG